MLTKPPIDCKWLSKDNAGYFCGVAALDGYSLLCPHSNKEFDMTAEGPRPADYVYNSCADGICRDYESKEKKKVGWSVRV